MKEFQERVSTDTIWWNCDWEHLCVHSFNKHNKNLFQKQNNKSFMVKFQRLSWVSRPLWDERFHLFWRFWPNTHRDVVLLQHISW
jgi:hypothetical protein